MAYRSGINTYYENGVIYCSDTWSFVAKTQRNSDTDNPSYNEAITGPYSQKYKIAMHKDIYQLIKQSNGA